MIKLRFLAVLAALALMLSIPAVASAQQTTPPHVFVGTAWHDGAVAPYGTVVTAWIGNEPAGTTVVRNDGRYEPLFVEEGNNGTLVTFSVGTEMASQAATWEKGGADLMDLTANTDVPPPGPIPTPEP